MRTPPLRRQFVTALPVCALLVLSGCASMPGERPAESVPAREWRGRFSLTVTRDDVSPPESSGGRFALVAGQRFSELELLSPLGNTIASARADDTGAFLRTADGRSWQAPNIGDLTEQVVGWRIPVERLPDWLDGRVARRVEAAVNRDVPADGQTTARPAGGTEDGWLVRFDQWGDALPQRLTLVYPGRVRLRLIVDDR